MEVSNCGDQGVVKICMYICTFGVSAFAKEIEVRVAVCYTISVFFFLFSKVSFLHVVTIL